MPENPPLLFKGKLYGRGATDNKGPVLAWINAVGAFRALQEVSGRRRPGGRVAPMLRAARPKPSAGCGLFLPLQSPGVWVTITPVLRMRRVRLGKVGERAHSHPAGLGWWTCHPEPIENGTRPKNVFRGAGTRRSCLRRASPCPSRPPTPSSRGEASSRQAHTHCGEVRERERERERPGRDGGLGAGRAVCARGRLPVLVESSSRQVPTRGV